MTQQGFVEQQRVQEELNRDLGDDENTSQEIKDAIIVAKKGLSFEKALAG